MAPLAQVVASLLEECNLPPSKVRDIQKRSILTLDRAQAGMLGDVKMLASVVGIPFTNLRDTTEELAKQFKFDLDPEKTTTECSWDDWASSTIERNAASSTFSEDDLIAQQIMMSTVFAPPS